VNRGYGVGVSLASNHAKWITGGTTTALSTRYRLAGTITEIGKGEVEVGVGRPR
jgi:hypothetical protein